MNFIKRLFQAAACIVYVLFIFSSCKKKDSEPTGLVIHNILDKKINFDLYRTPDDYYAHTNAKIKGYVEAGGVLSIPYDSLPDLTSEGLMFIDWYSDDLVYSNWGYDLFFSEYNINLPRLILYPGDKTDYSMSKSCPARITFLSGKYGDKSFKLVDCYSPQDSVHSLWPSLTAEEKKSELQFGFNLNHGFTYTYFDSTGAPYVISTGIIASIYDNSLSFHIPGVGYIQNCPSPNIRSERYSKDTIRLQGTLDRLYIYVSK